MAAAAATTTSESTALPDKQESASLKTILGNSNLSVEQFFESVWQEACAIFPAKDTNVSPPNHPYETLIRQGWNVLIDLLQQARRSSETESTPADSPHKPLLFQTQSMLSPDDLSTNYGSSLFAAFLDGCSVVMNHADLLSPWIAALCLDLQQSFPHAYANAYLTPARSQAVPPHADDRDVLVIQVVGSKAWKVYQRIPIPYPYSHEQVGKNGLEVPPAVLQGPVLVERTLQPGHVLYMPRGFVHEARATLHEPSFHVTIALATHDWSLAGLLLAASEQVWKKSLLWRKAVPRQLGTRDPMDASVKQDLQTQIDAAIQALQEEVTVEAIHEALTDKFRTINDRARSIREQVMARQPTHRQPSAAPTATVGRTAAEAVSLSSPLRLATSAEKASLPPTTQPRGLHVREPNHDALTLILQQFKANPALTCRVQDLRSLVLEQDLSLELICDLTLLSFARQCVELGALAICIPDGHVDAE